MVNYNDKYNYYLEYFNTCLNDALSNLSVNAPKIIKDAMIYATTDGGKRVRPVLCFAAADMLNVSLDRVKNFALAIEMIHSYSLVHDDLPCMDNDDYRRGKLSTHKKFGQANGVLAGDALLTYAFELCLSSENLNKNDIDAIKVLAEYSGYNGMIAGQVLDLMAESCHDHSEELLINIFTNKTSKLLTVPLLMASCIANKKYYDLLNEFGVNLGVMFQITDDVMDVEGTLESIGKTPNKDKSVNKLTSVSIFGLQGAKEKSKQLFENCLNILSKIENSEFLVEFTKKLYVRKK